MSRKHTPPGRSPIPSYQPQLAKLVKDPPEGDDWLHEMKFDGYRIGCRIDGKQVRLISRTGKEWTAAFPEVCEAARKLGVRRALLDGEVAMLSRDGRTSFQALQNVFTGGSRRGLVYFAFDVLHVDGRTLIRRPLEVRKSELLRLIGIGVRSRLRYSEHVIGKGATLFSKACRLGMEGIVSKRRDGAYTPGRGNTWLKTKCVMRQEFVIGGFTDPEGSRQGIGALLIGYYEGHSEGQRLVYAGKVGTGFPVPVARDLRQRLERLERRESPFTPPPGEKRARFVKPSLVGEVAFTEWTGDGKIRHPSFQGLRRDKRPADVRREDAASTRS